MLTFAALLLATAVSGTPDTIFRDDFQALECPFTIDTAEGTRSLQTRANVTYGIVQAQRPNVDLSEWNNIWGHGNATDGVTPWPGVGGSSPVITKFGRSRYIGAHFRTPASVSGLSGGFSNPSFAGGPNVTMAISGMCGDFDEFLPTPGCLKTQVPTSDANLVQWKFSSNAPSSWCNLQPNTDYYVNVMFSDPASTVECSRNSIYCTLAPLSYSGN